MNELRANYKWNTRENVPLSYAEFWEQLPPQCHRPAGQAQVTKTMVPLGLLQPYCCNPRRGRRLDFLLAKSANTNINIKHVFLLTTIDNLNTLLNILPLKACFQLLSSIAKHYYLQTLSNKVKNIHGYKNYWQWYE